jgi:hypothetical protein
MSRDVSSKLNSRSIFSPLLCDDVVDYRNPKPTLEECWCGRPRALAVLTIPSTRSIAACFGVVAIPIYASRNRAGRVLRAFDAGPNLLVGRTSQADLGRRSVSYDPHIFHGLNFTNREASRNAFKDIGAGWLLLRGAGRTTNDHRGRLVGHSCQPAGTTNGPSTLAQPVRVIYLNLAISPTFG